MPRTGDSLRRGDDLIVVRAKRRFGYRERFVHRHGVYFGLVAVARADVEDLVRRGYVALIGRASLAAVTALRM